MAKIKKFADYQAAKIAVSPIANTSGALTSNKINATEFGRVAFIFSFGTPSANAYLSSGCGIWQAATSGATFSRVTGASFAAITTGAGSNANCVIDVKVDQAYPWLQVSGQLDSSYWPLSVIAVLSEPAEMPVTSLSQQIVTV